MPTLTIQFTGVNAYVPIPKTTTDPARLEVYMPNATKLGISEQRTNDRLSPHRPTIWQFDAANKGRMINPENIRYFPWSEAHIVLYGGGALLDLAAIENAGGSKVDRFPLSKTLLNSVPRTAGKVVLKNGTCSVPSVVTRSWHTNPPQAVKYPLESVVNYVRVEIPNVTRVQVFFTSLIGAHAPVPLPVDIDPVVDDQVLAIGNVCAEDLLRWVKNDEHDYHDRDFLWLYELMDHSQKPGSQEPIPVIDQLGSPVDASEKPEQVLRDIDTGGGGGLGAECNGVIGDIKP